MLLIYRTITNVLYPILIIIVYLRKIIGKEDATRFKEKIFTSYFDVRKNEKRELIWLHVASIGELLSVINLIKELERSEKNFEFLVTTVTLSSGRIAEKVFKGKKNITHRYFPLDCNHLINNFLDRWKPMLVLFVDSEIWPNFLFAIKKRGIKLGLINARITEKTFYKWNFFKKTSKKVFSNFDFSFSGNRESEKYLKLLGVKKIKYFGNLKLASTLSPVEISEQNKIILNNYKVWCAASTHPGEEEFCFQAHIKIKKKHSNIVTIIIPRHINRISEIFKLSKKYDLKTQIIDNSKDILKKDIEIVLINSFGITDMFFNYCKFVFIGKSLIKKLKKVGGQNPIEAAKLGCKIFHGPYVYNFDEIYELLKIRKFSQLINTEDELSTQLIDNFNNSYEKIEKEKIKELDLFGKKILEETKTELTKFINI